MYSSFVEKAKLPKLSFMYVLDAFIPILTVVVKLSFVTILIKYVESIVNKTGLN